MNMLFAYALMEKYQVCPDCGNEYVGNGEGTLNVNEDTFERSCKCGWKVVVREDGTTHEHG